MQQIFSETAFSSQQLKILFGLASHSYLC